MYTNNHTTPLVSLATGPHSTTLRPPWWTIPEEERRCMHTFTKTSNQLHLNDRSATLRIIHNTFLYTRLILKAKAQGGLTYTTDTAIRSFFHKSPKKGINMLKFMYDQLYNDKLTYKYKLVSTDACPLCGLSDSCTHIAGECKPHNNQFINIHSAA